MSVSIGRPCVRHDADDGLALFLDPEPAFVAEVERAVGEVQRKRGGDRHIGRRLPGLLRAAGFADLTVDAVTAHSELVGFDALSAVFPLERLLELAEAAVVPREHYDAGATSSPGWRAAKCRSRRC